MKKVIILAAGKPHYGSNPSIFFNQNKYFNNFDVLKNILSEYSDKIRAEEEVFNTFKSDFGTLSNTQLKAIRDLQSIDADKTFEEVAKNYGMLNEAQLQRSKNGRQIMGNNIWVKWNEKQEKAFISERARKRLNIKSSERLAEIKESFGL